MDSFRNYKEALRNRYDQVKLGTYSHYLINPSQGNLRDLCFERMNDHKAADLIIFKSFLGFAYDDVSKRQIKDSREKFRPLTNFLKQSSDLSDTASADMLALLLDYEKRPFAAYLKRKGNLEEIEEPQKGVFEHDAEPPKPNQLSKRLGTIKRKWIVLIVFACLFGVLLLAKELSSKKCLKWTNNHYEVVDCDTPGNLKAYDKSLVDLRKVDISKNTKFFVNGKPRIWYSKHDGKTDYFNQPGIHPETGKQLEPITVYMARKIQGGF